jgi:short-subunit dehydrogenase
MSLAIITGASRGLGFENAKSLAALGHDIVMIAKDADRLKLVGEELQSQYPNQKFTT